MNDFGVGSVPSMDAMFSLQRTLKLLQKALRQKLVGSGWFNLVPSRLALDSWYSRSRNKLYNQELNSNHFEPLAKREQMTNEVKLRKGLSFAAVKRRRQDFEWNPGTSSEFTEGVPVERLKALEV